MSGVSGQHDVVTILQWFLGERLPGFSTHDDRGSFGNAHEPREVRRTLPRDVAVIPDEPIPGHGDDDSDLHFSGPF